MALDAKLALLITRIALEFKTHRTRLLPSGGTTGQVLAKTSASDYAATWQTPSGGSVPPHSVILDQTRGYDNSWAVPAVEAVQNGNANTIAMDLTGYTQARLVFRGDTYQVSATARLAAQYALNNPFGTWNYIDGASGPSALVAQGSSYMADSGWVTISVAARTFVFLRWVGVGGNGSTGYGFGTITMLLK